MKYYLITNYSADIAAPMAQLLGGYRRTLPITDKLAARLRRIAADHSAHITFHLVPPPPIYLDFTPSKGVFGLFTAAARVAAEQTHHEKKGNSI